MAHAGNLTYRETSCGTHCIGDRMGTKAGMDAVKNLLPSAGKSPIPWPSSLQLSMYRLSCTGSHVV
jgi:hypothetical protein